MPAKRQVLATRSCPLTQVLVLSLLMRPRTQIDTVITVVTPWIRKPLLQLTMADPVKVMQVTYTTCKQVGDRGGGIPPTPKSGYQSINWSILPETCMQVKKIWPRAVLGAPLHLRRRLANKVRTRKLSSKMCTTYLVTTTRCCWGGGLAYMNNFKQISSDDHEIALMGRGRQIWCPGGKEGGRTIPYIYSASDSSGNDAYEFEGMSLDGCGCSPWRRRVRIFYHSQTKLRESNVFTGVFLSTGAGMGISGPMSFLGGGGRYL